MESQPLILLLLYLDILSPIDRTFQTDNPLQIGILLQIHSQDGIRLQTTTHGQMSPTLGTETSLQFSSTHLTVVEELSHTLQEPLLRGGHHHLCFHLHRLEQDSE